VTFFLNGPDTPPKIKANNPDVDLDSLTFWGAAMPAATSSAALTNDANFRLRRETVKERAASGWDIASKIGSGAVMERAKEAGLPQGQIDLIPMMLERRSGHMSPELSSLIFEMGNEAKASSPDDWKDVDFSEEGMDAKINARLQKEYEADQQVLEMMPNGRGLADFLGGMVGITADIKNLPFLFMGGGGGSIFRVMGREAMINMAAETATLPSQFKMADRLEIPDPNIATHLLMAGAGGAAFGGALNGAQRGFVYWRGRDRIRDVPGFDDIQSRLVADQTEDILTSDTLTPLQDVQRLMEDAQREPPFLLENPLNPERPPLIPDESITTTPLGPADGGVQGGLSDNELIENAQKAIDDVAASDSPDAKPLTSYLRGHHRVTKKSIRAAEKTGQSAPTGGENLQVHPDGWAGQELKARGITTKSAPGLFSKKGRGDFDTLAADEMEELFPGIIEATGTSRDDYYLDRDGFIDVLVRDIEGDDTWLRSRQDADRLQNELNSYEHRTAIDDFHDYVPETEGGDGYINLDYYHFDDDPFTAAANIDRDVRAWMDEKELGDILTEAEKREIVAELQKNGGETDYLVERALEREVEYVESPSGPREAEDIPFDDIAGSDGARDAGSSPTTPEAGSGGAGDADGPDVARQSEGTADPDNPSLINTRGSGERYHGSRSVEIDGPLMEGSYSSLNYYGQGFYTTDAVSIADGYNKGGGIYRVSEIVPVNAFDMEQPVPNFMREHVSEMREGSDLTEVAQAALDENPPTVREFYDEIRAYSASYRVSADEVQELFEDLEIALKENGYNALDHIGGLRTKKSPHDVRIYFDPHETISVERVDTGDFKPVDRSVEAAALPRPLSERTAAGDQTLIDGVAPVSQRQRLEAAQNAPLRGGNAAADDGLFDVGARSQRDMFSDPASPEARVIQDSITDDIRTEIEADGPMEMPVSVEGGRVLKSDQEILDYLDEGDRAAAFFDVCGKGPSQ
jgi:hypothetical protein